MGAAQNPADPVI